MKWTCTSISGHTKYEGEEIILLTLEAATSLPFRVKIVNIFGEEKIHSKLTDMSYRVINGIKYVDFGFPHLIQVIRMWNEISEMYLILIYIE